MSDEEKYIRLLEESANSIESSIAEIEGLRKEGKYPSKDYGKTKLDISLSLANLSANKLNYYASKELRKSLSKSSKRQRELTWTIIIIGGANLLLGLLKLMNIIN